MSKIILTEEQFRNVKKVLFGNQKQSGVINDSVIHIVGSSLASRMGSECLDSEKSFSDACKNFLQGAIDHNHVVDENLVMLIAGRQSLINLQTEGPKLLEADYASPESPKMVFRIVMLGEEVSKDTEEVDVEENTVVETVASTAPVVLDSEALSSMSCYEAACMIRDAILPTVPATVRAEIDNDFAAALYCAEAYYRFKSETPLKGTVESKTKPIGVALTVKRFIDKYGADIIRAVYSGYTMYKNSKDVAQSLNVDQADVESILKSDDCKKYYKDNYTEEFQKSAKKPVAIPLEVADKIVATWTGGGSLADCAKVANIPVSEVKELLNARGYIVF